MVECWLGLFWVTLLVMAWWPCSVCCRSEGEGEAVVCPHCDEGTTQAVVALTMPSISAGDCSSCSSLSGGTFMLPQLASPFVCVWETNEELSFGDCGNQTIRFTAEQPFLPTTGWYVTVAFPDYGAYVWHDATDNTDCSAEYSIAIVQNTVDDCQSSGVGNVTITPQV